MIEVIDRNPTYPGRVKMIPVEGQENTFDMVRADAPIEPGTPINKALFDSIGGDISILNQNVANIINAHSSFSPIGSLAAGVEFGIYENGILVPFIKVDGDYGGTGRSAVMRKHIYKVDYLTTQGEGNRYANCLQDRWLNNEYLSLLDSLTRDAIEEVPVVYTIGAGNYSLDTIYRKAFIASVQEYGNVSGPFNSEGSAFSYFAPSSNRKVALFNGVATPHWTRSAVTSSGPSNTIGYVGADTSFNYGYPSTTKLGIRPVFTLPHDFEVNMATPELLATAEVI